MFQKAEERYGAQKTRRRAEERRRRIEKRDGAQKNEKNAQKGAFFFFLSEVTTYVGARGCFLRVFRSMYRITHLQD